MIIKLFNWLCNRNILLVRVHPDCPHKDPILPPAKYGDAGYDIRVWVENKDKKKILEPNSSDNIRTGVFVKIPDGYWGSIRPRSSTFAKKKIDIMDGTIDSGYTGEISIYLRNPLNVPVEVSDGDKLAQLVIIKKNTPAIKFVNELPITDRGSSGFGSTGI